MEYDTYDNLLFEGEYKNGEKNGEGYEYVYDENQEANIIIFEGEYKDGEIWNGKGKEFKSNELIFEGEYKYGKRWNGKGKEFDFLDHLLFEGEYKNGEKKSII